MQPGCRRAGRGRNGTYVALPVRPHTADDPPDRSPRPKEPHMPHRIRLVAIAVFAALFVVPSAFAQGGTGGGGTGGGGSGGGGGTTTSYAAINRVSDVPTCDAGTFVSVTLDKGANKQIEGTITMLSGTNPDGSSTLFGGWSVMLQNDTTGAS